MKSIMDAWELAIGSGPKMTPATTDDDIREVFNATLDACPFKKPFRLVTRRQARLYYRDADGKPFEILTTMRILKALKK